ncbi:hypothetical protein PC9H_000055 [Pleurotus ostreatus]|uniref:Uncharacterized protein n=1 Tax=Pleurotus ostreatus TaxID=5322 RepID=A0A8H7A2U2_PLEOS|nr:uncharacterized protein PC9H_000055 [Pleurotus ostreatus]KAF7439719.1 hypothetical protein PC9H_000055 [Pleurotus ostreatus]
MYPAHHTRTNRSINFDKRQIRTLGNFPGFTGFGVIKNLMLPRPFPALDTVFSSIFPGHNLAAAASFNKPALGRLGTLPTELLVYIFNLSDFDGAAMLGATHAHLFVIGYASIRARIQSVKPRTSWAYDRIICFGDWACTLPHGFLSDAEKHRLMRWRIAHKDTLDIGMGAPLDALPERTETETAEEREERKHEVAGYEDQSFHLAAYASGMLRYELNSSSSYPSLSAKLVRRAHTSPVDQRRIRGLEDTLWRVADRELRSPRDDELREAVLVNATKREFVWARGREEGGRGEMTIEIALAVLTIWAGEDGDGEPDEKRYTLEGEWAGDRLAIVSQEEAERLMQTEEGWTEKKVKWEDTWLCDL